MPLVQVKGTRVRYRAADGPSGPDRPVCLLLHGAGAHSGAWVDQMKALSPLCRPVAVDLPGHGQTAGPPRTSTGALVDFVVAFIEALKLEGRLVVGGHSLGARVAVELAVEHRARVGALLLLAPAASFPVSAALEEAARGRLQRYREVLSRDGFSPEAQPDLVRRYLSTVIDAPPETVVADLAAGKAPPRADLGEVYPPALLLAGAHDRITPREATESLGRRLPRAEVKIVPGAGHMLTVERGDFVNEALRGFLAREIPRGVWAT